MTCQVPECGTEIQPNVFLCSRHWYLLPYNLRMEVLASYKSAPVPVYEATTSYALRLIRFIERR